MVARRPGVNRFGVLGDIHAEDRRVAASLRLFAAESVDAILAVGDVADGAGDLDRACGLLASAGALAVRGNHDRWVIAGEMRALPEAHRAELLAPSTRDFLASLPPTRTFSTDRGPLLLCHGLGENDMQRLLPEDEGYELANNDELHALLASPYRFVVAGHTHRRMVRRIEQLLVVNAGTLRAADAPACLVLDVSERRARWYALDDPDVPVLVETVEWDMD